MSNSSLIVSHLIHASVQKDPKEYVIKRKIKQFNDNFIRMIDTVPVEELRMQQQLIMGMKSCIQPVSDDKPAPIPLIRRRNKTQLTNPFTGLALQTDDDDDDDNDEDDDDLSRHFSKLSTDESS